MRPLDKKGRMSLDDLYPSILAIILIGITLGAGLYILTSLHDSIQANYTGTQNSINASAGTTTLTDASKSNFNLTSISSVVNQTGTAATNYTFTSAGVITWGANIVSASGVDLLNVTYAYTYDNDATAEAAITNVSTGLDDFASWIAIIVVVIAAAIVLGVVLSSFGRNRARI